jgi:hypothetical protein
MQTEGLLGRATALLEGGQPAAAAEMARTALTTERDPGRTVRLMAILADALIALGDYTGGINVLHGASALVGSDASAESADLTRRTARAYILGQRRLRGGGPAGGATEAQAWAERVIGVGSQRDDPGIQAEGEALQALVHALSGHPVRARAHVLRASRLAHGSTVALRVAPDFPALLALSWWLSDEPGEAAATIDRAGRDRPDERSLRAAGRFEAGDIAGAGREASAAWDGAEAPRGLEGLGGLLAWPSTDPALAARAAQILVDAHRAGFPLALPHLSLSLAARALLRSGHPGLAQETAAQVAGAVTSGWPRGAAALAYEVMEDADALGRFEDGSVAALRRDRIRAAGGMDVDSLLAVRRRFQTAGLPFESVETFAAAGRAAYVGGDQARSHRILSEAAEAYMELGASVEAARVRQELIRTARRPS